MNLALRSAPARATAPATQPIALGTTAAPTLGPDSGGSCERRVEGSGFGQGL